MKFTLKTLLLALFTAGTVFFSNTISSETNEVAAPDNSQEVAAVVASIDELVHQNVIADQELVFAGQYIDLGNVNGVVAEVATTPAVAATVASAPVAQAAATQVASAPVAEVATTSEATAKEEIARRESGGSYTAQNGQYYGRYQLTNTYLNGDYSPENQEAVADAYVAGRYGSWAAALAFHNANGWY